MSFVGLFCITTLDLKISGRVPKGTKTILSTSETDNLASPNEYLTQKK